MQAAPEGESGPAHDQSEWRNTPTLVTRETLSEQLRRSVAETARADGDKNRLWESASSLGAIHGQYMSSEKPASALEIDLHDLWFTYYHAAKNHDADNPILDRLFVQILQARELGPLRKSRPADEKVETEAATSDGVIWSDLPFLVPDMTAFWLQDWPAMSSSNLTGFTTFLAKLASLGICSDGMSGLGLTFLRDALETPRPLGAGSDQHAEDPTRHPQDVTVAALLPAVNCWLFHAGHKIVQLADARCATPAGFSPERWLFWLKRLGQIVEGAESAGDAELAGITRRFMDNMIFVAEERPSEVKQLLEDSPGVILYQPVMQVFGPN